MDGKKEEVKIYTTFLTPKARHVINQNTSRVVFPPKILLPKERHQALIVSKYSSLRKGSEEIGKYFTICKQNRRIQCSKY